MQVLQCHGYGKVVVGNVGDAIPYRICFVRRQGTYSVQTRLPSLPLMEIA